MRKDDSMTIKDYMKECELYKYSNEAYEIQKGISELELMESYLDNQLFLMENSELLSESVFTEGYFAEAIDKEKLKEMAGKAVEKAKGIISTIWKGMKNIWNSIISFFTGILKKLTNAEERLKTVTEKIGNKEIDNEEILEIVSTVIGVEIKDDSKESEKSPIEPKASEEVKSAKTDENIEEEKEEIKKRDPKKPIRRDFTRLDLRERTHQLLLNIFSGSFTKNDIAELNKLFNFTKDIRKNRLYDPEILSRRYIKFAPDVTSEQQETFIKFIDFAFQSKIFLGKYMDIYVHGAVSQEDFTRMVYDMTLSKTSLDLNYIDGFEAKVKEFEDRINHAEKEEGFWTIIRSDYLIDIINEIKKKFKDFQDREDEYFDKISSSAEMVKHLNKAYGLTTAALPPTIKTYTNYMNIRIRTVSALEKIL